MPGPAPEATDATQADMGLDAGMGAIGGEATDNPRGADPLMGAEGSVVVVVGCGRVRICG